VIFKLSNFSRKLPLHFAGVYTKLEDLAQRTLHFDTLKVQNDICCNIARTCPQPQQYLAAKKEKGEKIASEMATPRS